MGQNGVERGGEWNEGDRIGWNGVESGMKGTEWGGMGWKVE